MTIKKKRGPKHKTTDNEEVAQYLIKKKWSNLLCQHTEEMLPSFVDDAVWAAIYICAGSHKGKVNISPKLVFRAIMLPVLSVEAVKNLHIFHDTEMSDRKARRICQTARFAIEAITSRVREEEAKEEMNPDQFVNWKLEKQFVESFYSSVEHDFQVVLPKTPKEIDGLYNTGNLDEYREQLRAFKEEIITDELVNNYGRNIKEYYKSEII